MLGWIALAPLLISIARHPDLPWLRAVHGLAFGLFIAAWSESWFIVALRERYEIEGKSAVFAFGGAMLVWFVLALPATIFALAASVLFEARRIIVPILGVPLLWTGLEVLRGPYAPVASSWVNGWVAVGYAFDPDRPEAQIASLVGIHGLSALAVLCATLLALCLRVRSLRGQTVLALAALALPLITTVWGARTLADVDAEDATPGAPVALIAERSHQAETLVRYAKGVAPTHPILLLNSGAWMQPDGMAPKTEQVDGAAPDAAPQDAVAQLAHVLSDERGIPATALVIGDGRLVAAYDARRDGRGRPIEVVGEHGRLFASRAGVFALLVDFDALDPGRVRRAVRPAGNDRTSGLLASAVETSPVWGETAHEQIAAMHAYRAIESRRWLLYASGVSASLIHPSGQPRLELKGGVDAASGEVTFRSSLSVYTRGGWWLEPIALFSAAGTILCALRAGRHRRRRDDDPAPLSKATDSPARN